MADERKTQATTTPHAPAPTGGAHHGPGDAPGPGETIQAFFERLKNSGWLSSKLLAVIVVAVIGFFIFRFVSSSRKNAAAIEWISLDRAASVEDLEAIVKKDPNSAAGRVALLAIARHDLNMGIVTMKTREPAEQATAIEKIEKARDNFRTLSKSFEKDPVQYPECLLGIAKAELALVGVPKKDNPVAHLGEVAEAVKYFEMTADAAGSTPLGEAARERANYLKKNANEVTQLQSGLYRPLGKGVPDDDIHRGLPMGPGGFGPGGFGPGGFGPGGFGPDMKDFGTGLPPELPKTPDAKVDVVPPTPPVAPLPKVEPAPAPTPVPPEKK